ncbi:MAG: FAD-dependent oxidoreductase, partial [Pseudomonadota bacterium]
MEGNQLERILILGAGQAGASLAARLRAQGHTGPVTLIGAEGIAPYQRPPLSKGYLLGDMPQERLLLRAQTFWADQNIGLLTGLRATTIDRKTQTVSLSDGQYLPYDRLALTTGARPRQLPKAAGGALRGVYSVRSLADIDALRSEARPGRRALILGGGYIGLEAAAVLRKLDLEVILVEAAPRILGRVASAETADWFRALHQKHGVEVHEGIRIDHLVERAGKVAAARLEDGRDIACDLAVIGIGVDPDIELAATAGLFIDNGIAVDAVGRSSDPNIFAAGDCASFPWRGRRVRLESVQNAIEQAEAAADAMLGKEVTYDPMPWFWSDQYDVKLQIAGLNQGHDHIVTRPG